MGDAMQEEVSGTGGYPAFPHLLPHHHHHPHGQEDAMYDENPSDEQDAMKEEVSGTGGYPTFPHLLPPHHHHPHGQEDAMYDENPSDEQDAMNEVSGTEKGLASNIKKGGKAVAKAVKKMVKSGAWRNFLPGNNPWYD